MKKTFLISIVLSVVVFQACDKAGLGDAVYLSNTVAPYASIPDTEPIVVVQGEEAEVTFAVRTAFQEEVTLYYNVSGAIDLPDQSAVLERNKTSTTVSIPVPDGLVNSVDETAEAVVTLTKATTAGGTELRIGAINDPENQNVSLIIVKE